MLLPGTTPNPSRIAFCCVAGSLLNLLTSTVSAV
ncbi:hypothetical protein [Salmonella phage SD-2_S15]|nr:hypothetical protein [Salmonella phage SD-2_S15]WPK19460.1 hypothetical protein [Salmonella phage SD-6_S16]